MCTYIFGSGRRQVYADVNDNIVKLSTIIEGDLKASFSIAITSKCR